MAFWLVHEKAVSADGNWLMLPPSQNGQWPDITSCHSISTLKSVLKEALPGQPPEAYARMAEKLNTYVLEVEKGDVVGIIQPDKHLLTFAEISGDLTYHDDEQKQALPLQSLKPTLGMRRLHSHKAELEATGQWLTPVKNTKLRLVFRDALKLPGSRFRMLKWLVAAVVLIRLIEFSIRMWREETRGF